MSYTYADPACAQGEIDTTRLWRYLEAYRKISPLTQDDLAAMPYLYLYWLGALNFYEPYEALPEEYLRVARLCTRLLEYLAAHSGTLSRELLAREAERAAD